MQESKVLEIHPEERRVRSKIEEARQLARLDERGITLYIRFLKLRREIAKEVGVPAYQVLGNKALIGLARVAPSSLQQLAEIPGVGRLRAAAYGRAFLAESARLPAEAPPKEDGQGDPKY